MSGFLSSLAGLALGVPAPGAARLSLPPRFAPVRDTGWIEAAGEGRAAVALADAAGPAREPASWVAPAPVIGREPTPAAGPPARRPIASFEPAAREASSEPPVTEAASAGVPPVRPVPSEPTRPVAVPSVRAPEAASIGAEPRRSRMPAAEPPPQRRVAEIVATAPRAPLSAAAVASRAGIERDARPVVHVTIDRIDVRAPRDAEKPEAAPKRAKVQPQISLADYLGARS